MSYAQLNVGHNERGQIIQLKMQICQTSQGRGNKDDNTQRNVVRFLFVDSEYIYWFACYILFETCYFLFEKYPHLKFDILNHHNYAQMDS